MRLYAELPPDRQAEGTFWVSDGGEVILGPVRARGEADLTGLTIHGPPQEDPSRSYGDHPYGLYRVTAILRAPQPFRSYGPAFIRIDPLRGEALIAKDSGREGFGIHGGAVHPDGRLRETHGSLRLDNDALVDLVSLIEPWLIVQYLFYECRPPASLRDQP